MKRASASRSSASMSPALPSSLVGQSAWSHMVFAIVPSTRNRVQLSGSSSSQFGSTSALMEDVLRPPNGSPGMPSQW